MTKVFHTHLWGTRENKYKYLEENDVSTIEWTEIFPNSPFYLFIPQNTDCIAEYEQGWKITDIMPVNSTGVKTHRDQFVFDFNSSALYERIKQFRDLNISDEKIATEYELTDTNSWILNKKRQSLIADLDWERYFTKCLYRPFDTQFYYCHEYLVDRPRNEVMRHLFLKSNLALVFMRQVALQEEYSHFLATNYAVDNRAFYSNKGTMALAPLYLYPDTDNPQKSIFTDDQIKPNISSNFLSTIREKLGYIPTPEAIFYYIYAIFYSPTYRQRYAEFLKIDFPRVPLTSHDNLFKALSEKGQELVDLHLMKSQKLSKLITKIGGSEDNTVTEVTYKPKEKRVYINKERYFEGIDIDVWEFKIGGYQVLDKWLKDRKKADRTLSFDDLLHYQKIVVALKETMQLMQEIDRLIPSFPIE